ncbi:MFS transporter [Methylobacterium frigidaeris]|uniref:Inner membrane transport protein YdhP n=1 Tax=Methylobacterium frigidaeris TaxID=2038277 RepID=A0AA37M2S5_9HYPH|nr:MFS transporter [Methylobacterium frigidaeris]PIK71168.1 MFS transporter [Methylobacterium frigidaeris]GJD60833.1 Inner membrane transport protein YdhP [Methylobacterium frigidaeris]
MQHTLHETAGGVATGRPAALALLALAAASFGIGTTEFVIMGLLPEMASDLGVGIPTAGLLVSGYALSVTFGSPLVAVALARLDRRRALLVLIGLFILGNALCALAPNYRLLMLARIVTALCHGAFFGLGSVVAADLVPPHRKASAIAIMFTGLTLANVLGVPFGTALGHALGWRATFWAVVGIGLVAAAALLAWLPRHLAQESGSLLSEMRVLRRTQVVLAMLLSVLASASLFSVFTYVAPLLAATAGATPSAITGVLLLFGVGLTVGNVLGGRLGDWRQMPSVIGLALALVVVLVALVPASAALMPATALIGLWGILAFALVAPLQLRVLTAADGARNLASTVNQGAFNLGNALGAWLGGVAITAGIPYGHLPVIGAVLALAVAGVGVVAHRLDR